VSRTPHAVAGGQFTEDGADERTEQQPRQPKEDANHASQQGSPYGARGGTGAFCAKRTGQ
jgi:hypothetical protein